MSSRTRPLTADGLSQLPADCRSCLFWELPDARRGPAEPSAVDDAREAKYLWHRSSELESGPSGVVLTARDQTLGFALWVPAAHARRTRRLGVTPSDDALLLATIWVAPHERGRGHAKALVQEALRHAHDAGFRAVEALGTRLPPSSCLLTESFLVAVGFEMLREHPHHPVLRIDLRSTVRWHGAVEHALEGVRSAFGRREGQPAPSSA